jgi:hypothetical protein
MTLPMRRSQPFTGSMQQASSLGSTDMALSHVKKSTGPKEICMHKPDRCNSFISYRTWILNL